MERRFKDVMPIKSGKVLGDVYIALTHVWLVYCFALGISIYNAFKGNSDENRNAIIIKKVTYTK